MSRGTQATINLDNLRHNFQVLKTLTPNKIILVVKADAYGHGLKQIVQALDDVDCFAVATIDEALTIRQIQPNVRILLLEGYLNVDELQIAIEHKFDSVIHHREQITLLSRIVDSKINIWLKYDSGMNRLGFNDIKFSYAINKLEALSQVNELILMSHLASANIQDHAFTKQQSQKFLQLVGKQQLSLANSAALLSKRNLIGEWCRVGLALFGVSPFRDKIAADFDLKPVMTLKTNIIAIKKVRAGQGISYGQTYVAENNMTIAIIGIGYGDGYPWNLKPSAYVKINNKKTKIVGSVTMDMLAVDITAIEKEVNIGDSVLIWGEDNNAKLPIEAVAENANTIPYVLLCQLTSRVNYKYVE